MSETSRRTRVLCKHNLSQLPPLGTWGYILGFLMEELRDLRDPTKEGKVGRNGEQEEEDDERRKREKRRGRRGGGTRGGETRLRVLSQKSQNESTNPNPGDQKGMWAPGDAFWEQRHCQAPGWALSTALQSCVDRADDEALDRVCRSYGDLGLRQCPEAQEGRAVLN